MCPPSNLRRADHRICHPESLGPALPIPHATRSHRRVRNRDGQVKTRLILQPSPSCQQQLDEGHAVTYSLDSMIVDQAKKGVAIFLATAMVPESAGGAAAAADLRVSSTHPHVVIKTVPQPAPDDDKPLACVDNPFVEVGCLELLGASTSCHPNVIQLLDVLQDDHFVYLVLPYLAGGDLFTKIKANGSKGLPEPVVARYMRDIVQGLLFMKRQARLSHRDLSLENLMLDSEGKVRIIDLGMCLKVPRDSAESMEWEEGEGEEEDEHPSPTTIYLTPQPSRGKPSYVPPEVVHMDPHDPFAADVWSLGVCAHIMLTGRPLYSSPQDQAFQMMAEGLVHEVVAAYEGFGVCMPAGAKELICRMLDSDASKRPTLEEILEHPWLASFAMEDHGFSSVAGEDSSPISPINAATTSTMRRAHPLIRRGKLSVKGRHAARCHRTHETSKWLRCVGWIF